MNSYANTNAYSMKTLDRAMRKARIERSRVFHAMVRSVFGVR